MGRIVTPQRESASSAGTKRYAAVDVHYPPEGGAVGALVVATDPAFSNLTDGFLLRTTGLLVPVDSGVPQAFLR